MEFSYQRKPEKPESKNERSKKFQKTAKNPSQSQEDDDDITECIDQKPETIKDQPDKPENRRNFLKSLKKDFYLKRDKEPDEIISGIYLGSIGAAYNKRILQELKIEYILCCSDGIEPVFPTVIIKELYIL